jgi:hypothetical protein
MRKILALGLAALLAGTTLTATAASAKDWHHNHHHGHYYGGGWGWGGGWAPFAFGTMLGYGLGSYYNQPYYGYGGGYYNGGYYGDSHVQWCASHYRTYNPRTNTFFVRPGVPQVCVSPFG